MAGPSWLADTFAVVVIVIAAYTASRLLVSRLWRRATELDADGVHVFMGVAMAGMMVPRLSSLRAGVWEAVFAASAAWFAWQAARARRGGGAGSWRCLYPVPHLIESAAMVYMLLAVPGSRSGSGPAAPLGGIGGSSGAGGPFPGLGFVLALFMIGYVVWTADRLTSLAPARAAAAAQGGQGDLTGSAAAPGAMAATCTRATSSPAGTLHGHPPYRQMLAPRAAACYKIAMAIIMGYMLILML
jgi:Domain of unknown function (DUF5134)